MGYFSPAESAVMDDTIQDVLTNYIDTRKSEEPFKSSMARYGGVDVVWTEKEADEADRLGRPFAHFRLTDHNTEFWRKRMSDGTPRRGRRHFYTYSVDIVATEFSGSIKGAANPKTSIAKIRDFFFTIFDSVTGKEALEELKIEEVDWKADAEAARDVTRVNPHQLTFTVHGLDE